MMRGSFEAVEGFGGEAVMTPESCRNGTERAFEAVRTSPSPTTSSSTCRATPPDPALGH
jgi:CMP-2-keto-3-deoxyoctulosonic acid synthetase